MMKNLVVSAPGKVILSGEHSVVYGKTAIAVSLNLRTTMKVFPSDSTFLELHIINYPVKRWALSDISKLDGLPHVDSVHPTELSPEGQILIRKLVVDEESVSPLDQASVAVLFLAKSLLNSSRGLKLEIESELPMSAGLGSSASFSVCLSTAFLFLAEALSIKWQGVDNEEIHWLPADLDLINKWAFVIEKIFHGSPSGIDNNTSSYGGAVVYKSGVFNHLENIPNVKILLVNTMVQRNTKEIIQDVKNRKLKYPTIIEPILESMDQLASTCVQTFSNQTMAPTEFYDTIEDLMDINQALLNALNVSHPSLQEVFSIAAHYNCHSKLTGAGRGGFAFVLIRPETPVSRVDSLKSELTAKGFQCLDVVIGGRGVQLGALTS